MRLIRITQAVILFLFLVASFQSAFAEDNKNCKDPNVWRENSCLTPEQAAEKDLVDNRARCLTAMTDFNTALGKLNTSCSQAKAGSLDKCIQAMNKCEDCRADDSSCEDSDAYSDLEEKWGDRMDKDPTLTDDEFEKSLPVDAREYAYCPEFRAESAEMLEDKREERKKDKESYEDDLVKQNKELQEAMAESENVDAEFQEEIQKIDDERENALEAAQKKFKTDLDNQKAQYEQKNQEISALMGKITEVNLKLEVDTKTNENMCYDDAMNYLYRKLDERRNQIATTSLPEKRGMNQTVSSSGQSRKTINKNMAAGKYSDCIVGKKFQDTINLLRKAHLATLSQIQSQVDAARKAQAQIILDTTGPEKQEEMQKILEKINKAAERANTSAMRKYQNDKKRAETARNTAMAELKKTELRLKQADTELEQIDSLYSLGRPPKGRKYNPDTSYEVAKGSFVNQIGSAQGACGCDEGKNASSCKTLNQYDSMFNDNSSSTVPKSGTSTSTQTK